MRTGGIVAKALAAALIAAPLAAGCESTADVIMERESLKNHAALAQLYYDKGRFSQAASQAEKALEIDGTHSKARCVLGFTYLQVARRQGAYEARVEYYEKAEEQFNGAIGSGSETDSYIFKSYFGLGLLYFQWAKDVDAQIEKKPVEAASPALDGPSSGEEDLWKE